jgi:predicted aspartyl protease
MGVFSVRAELGDPEQRRLETVDLTVDTGSSYTTLPASRLRGLGVQPIGKQRFALADGRIVEADVGQTWIRLGGSTRMTVVAFDEEDAEPLLGAVTLEEFGLGVDAVAHKLVPAIGYRLTRMRLDD